MKNEKNTFLFNLTGTFASDKHRIFKYNKHKELFTYFYCINYINKGGIHHESKKSNNWYHVP